MGYAAAWEQNEGHNEHAKILRSCIYPAEPADKLPAGIIRKITFVGICWKKMSNTLQSTMQLWKVFVMNSINC